MKKGETTRTMTRRSRRSDSLLTMPFQAKTVTLLLMICVSVRVGVGLVVEAWTPSRSSSFVIGSGGRAMTVQRNTMILSSSCCKSHLQAHQWTMYQESNANDRSMASSDPKHNAWAVLSKTEAWISSTLANANTQQSSTTSSTSSSSSSSASSSSNPYVRKEVSYYCENQTTSPIIMIASIFRHIKDIRIIGEQHIASEIQRMRNNNHRDIEPSTMRQTHVIVIPSIPEITSSFVLFDTLVQRINTARRNARDYIVTDTTTGTMEADANANRELQEKFSVAINCAHLHPSFGQQQQQISSTTRSKTMEDDQVENDPKYIEYQKQRLLARQSPYPTIVVEVRVTPTPDFFIDTTTVANTAATASKSYLSNPDRGSVSLSDIQKLEAIFSKSAHIKEVEPPKEQQTYTDDYLWDHLLGNSIREVTSSRRRATISPIEMAQEWIQQSQSKQSSSSSSVSFTTTDTSHVDAAYEFVFLNIAMLLDNNHNTNDDNTDESSSTGSSDGGNGIYYLVFPNYLRYAATSFEKFVNEIQSIYTAATTIETSSSSSSSSVPAVVSFTTYHPEHVQPSNRSPIPILAIQRTNMNSS